jgi:hypothetical protein
MKRIIRSLTPSETRLISHEGMDGEGKSMRALDPSFYEAKRDLPKRD